MQDRRDSFPSSDNAPNGLELPDGPLGRVATALSCFAFGVPAAFFLYALVFRARRPIGIDAILFRIIVESMLLWLAVFCVLGLTWAICPSERIERLLQSATRKLSFAIFWFCLFSAPFVLWALWQA